MSKCGSTTAYTSQLSGQPFVCDRPAGHPGSHQEHANLRQGRVVWQTWTDEEAA